MSWDNLLKKIRGLNDLRAAITEVRSLEKKVVKPGAPAPDDRTQAKQELSRSTLKHLGVNTTMPGVMTHQIGVPGSDWLYHVHMNMHNAAQQKPSFTVQHVGAGGHVKSQHPKLHDSISSAVKAIVHHAHHGEWNE